jgi:protein-S-isoprenylcysteine O-methyltransferase Ste14
MTNPLKSLTLVAIQFACLFAIALSGPIIARQPLWLALEVAGLALGGWALLSMRGGPFNIVPDPKVTGALVQHGPYRLIRHPMYSALLLMTLALVCDTPSVFRWLLWVVLLVNFIAKLSYEEQLLAARYESYRAYQSMTRRLIPFVY